MKRTFIKRVVLALLGFCLIAGVLVFQQPQDEESIGHTITFSNGTTMTLREISYGREHRYLTNWQGRLISQLPKKLAARFETPLSVARTRETSIVLWFERLGGPVNGDPKMLLFDEAGTGGGGMTSIIKGPGGATIEGWVFEAWPRRGKTFTVRVYEPGQRYGEVTPSGDFTIQNPTREGHAEWTAQPFPVTATDGELSATLIDLKAGTGTGSNKWRPGSSPPYTTTRAGFKLQWRGTPTREWKIASVTTSDATGNVLRSSRNYSHTQDAEYTAITPHLWPTESAWKLRVGFSQRSNFVAGETWTIRIPISIQPDATRIILTTNLQGAEVRYDNRDRTVQWAPSLNEARHNVSFRITPDRQDYRLTLSKVADIGGKTVKEGPTAMGNGKMSFELSTDTNETTLELTVALHRTRYLDFLVKPEMLSTNETDLFRILPVAWDERVTPSQVREDAERGETNACLALGRMYFDGGGVGKDLAEAVKWFRNGAESGSAICQFNLGTMYALGKGVPEDRIEAYRWFHAAARGNLIPAQEAVAHLEAQLTNDQRTEGWKRFMDWIRANAKARKNQSK